MWSKYEVKSQRNQTTISIIDGKVVEVAIEEGSNVRNMYKAAPQGFEQPMTDEILKEAFVNFFIKSLKSDEGQETLEDLSNDLKDKHQQGVMEEAMFDVADKAFEVLKYLPDGRFAREFDALQQRVANNDQEF